MKEITFEEYEFKMLSEMVDTTAGLNPEVLKYDEKEAREKYLWVGEEKLPTKKQREARFKKRKEELQAESDERESKRMVAEDNLSLKSDLDALIYSLLEKDQDLGLTAKELATFNLLRDYAVQDAIVFLQENSTLTKES